MKDELGGMQTQTFSRSFIKAGSCGKAPDSDQEVEKDGESCPPAKCL